MPPKKTESTTPTSDTPKRKRGRPAGQPKTAPQPVLEPHISITGKTTVKYLNNADMLKAVLESKEMGHMSDTLARMLMMLVRRYASKGNFSGYSYNDEMQSFALVSLTRTWASFDPAKSSNCFAYFTQCTHNSFIQYLAVEKKQQLIRDEMMIDGGLMPSYSYQLDHASQHHSDHDPYGDDTIREYSGEAYSRKGGGSGLGSGAQAIDKHFESEVDDSDDEDGAASHVEEGISPRNPLDEFLSNPEDD